ncbi:acyl-CoA dehydrogenase family protein [Actinoplanes sp. G11-F43]|uniref:acyl-CoA dehydrogenase family protein n=1 Tax=Actinoplanes sp. G11-F43 TaxID=3424130 RepID=UPI003D347761
MTAVLSDRAHDLVAATDGPCAALTALLATGGSAALPAGPGGHLLLPATAHPEGCRGVLARIPTDDGELVACRGPDHAVAPAGPAWTAGIAAIRLGLAERLLDRVTRHLRGRTVDGTVTLNLPMVRGLLADAAAGLAEARVLLDGDTGADALHRVHRALDGAGRICLHLFGAAGLLAGGPGALVRVSELLADTYPPPTDLGGS